MKKLVALLFVMALGLSLVAKADKVYQVKQVKEYKNKFNILDDSGEVDDGSHVYTVSSTMNYKVLETMNRPDPRYTDEIRTSNYNVAHVSFTTNEDVYLGVWTDIDGQATKGEAHIDLDLDITDYGIYFLDENPDAIDVLHSTKDHGVNVTAGREFGVYYKDGNGNTFTTTENWLASFDKANEDNLVHYDNHVLENGEWFTNNQPAKTSAAFFCFFQGDYDDWPRKLEWDHVEFGFATGEVPAGQPLPGTLATIIISGICAASLRKRNKK